MIRGETAIRRGAIRAATLCALLLLAACAGFSPPPPYQDAGFTARAATRSQEGLTVSAAALGPEEARAVFGLPMIERGIQPVWLRVENATGAPVHLMPLFFDPVYYTPAEAAFINHGWFSDETNAEINRLLEERHLPVRVAAGESTEGFLYGTPDLGQKALNIIYLAAGTNYTFSFVVEVPGLAREQVDLAKVYTAGEIRNIETGPELRDAIEALPCCVTDASGEIEADPLNFVLIAGRQLGLTAAIGGGWDQTETVTSASAWRTLLSFLFGSAYRYSPVSDLYVFGRKQDAAFQIAREDIHQRNHLRIWLTPLRFRGVPVWIGAISRDIGVIRSGLGTTHKIDPYVDYERWYLAQSLARAQALKRFAYAGGGPISTPEAPRSSVEARNVFYSDGLRIVLELSDKPIGLNDIEYIIWEPTPPGAKPPETPVTE